MLTSLSVILDRGLVPLHANAQILNLDTLELHASNGCPSGSDPREGGWVKNIVLDLGVIECLSVVFLLAKQQQ